MPDLYTQQKLAIQGQFAIGTLADYRGQKTALSGTVKVIKHERKGGVYIEADGVTALVSPFALTPVATVRPRGAGKRPEAPQNGQRPAKLIRNGVEVVPDQKAGKADVLLDRLRQIGRPTEPPAPVAATPPPVTPQRLTAPLGKANVDRFLFGWLKHFRRDTSHAMRQAVIDGFGDLPAYLNNHVPALPGLHAYRATIYYVAAVELADPSRLPPPAEIPPLVSARFGVSEEAVAIHLKWMRARLEADHARYAYVAKLHPAPVGAAE